MRLIDADELIERAARMRLDTRERIIGMIHTAPTIEADPVKTGKWVDKGDAWVTCSICREPVLKNIHVPLLRSTEFYNYCPNCGCRMENEDEL